MVIHVSTEVVVETGDRQALIGYASSGVNMPWTKSCSVPENRRPERADETKDPSTSGLFMLVC